MIHHRAKSGGNKPPLESIPLTSDEAQRVTRIRLNGHKAKSARTAAMMAGVLLMLSQGPMSMPGLAMALLIRKEQAKWAIKKLKAMGAIQKTDDKRWRVAK